MGGALCHGRVKRTRRWLCGDSPTRATEIFRLSFLAAYAVHSYMSYVLCQVVWCWVIGGNCLVYTVQCGSSGGGGQLCSPLSRLQPPVLNPLRTGGGQTDHTAITGVTPPLLTHSPHRWRGAAGRTADCGATFCVRPRCCCAAPCQTRRCRLIGSNGTIFKICPRPKLVGGKQ